MVQGLGFTAWGLGFFVLEFRKFYVSDSGARFFFCSRGFHGFIFTPGVWLAALAPLLDLFWGMGGWGGWVGGVRWEGVGCGGWVGEGLGGEGWVGGVGWGALGVLLKRKDAGKSLG